MLAFVARSGFRATRRSRSGHRGLVAVLAGVGVAFETLVQSLTLSMREITMLSFWIPAGLFAAAPQRAKA